ncbi:hypothetical protein LRS13_12370 [Svornostia abyssi]|uniref:MFS transporter n=1 Tax=Svornostia abyssi TaxID=2898438 RepID=A0ABY5PNH0_9ACTN|nr:hypothetical protein LRS13_12370 [Parviterribacteraceae bacterium J379]
MSALRIHPFGRLLATYTLDEAADWLVGIALAVFVYDRTHSALAVAALLMATRFGPSLVIAPLAGRLGTVRLGTALGGLYLGAAAVAFVLAALTHAPLPVLYALTFALSTSAAIGRVLTRTAASNLLDEHGKLREGIAAMNVSAGAINVLGPALAGTITALVGTQAGVLAAAGVFTGLAMTTWRLNGSAAGTADEHAPSVSVREALRMLSATPSVAAILFASALLLVLLFMDEPILIPYIEGTLGGTTASYATLLTVWGVGLLLGGCPSPSCAAGPCSARSSWPERCSRARTSSSVWRSRSSSPMPPRSVAGWATGCSGRR